MTQIKTDISDLPTRELCRRIDNCLEASTKLNDDCLLSFCSITADELDYDVDWYLFFQSCWNIYSWLRQSMKCLIFLRFKPNNIILFDLDRIQLYDLINKLKEQLLIVYSFYPEEYDEVERYLEVFYLMSQE
ncbi:hypothetical protein [Calothrix sp. CCY 0018]|uniref:hypothetical protein n=1 Tax=Calothrix sp. CCY 0018 TaxID=3103864 RepID=UPI0039C698C1